MVPIAGLRELTLTGNITLTQAGAVAAARSGQAKDPDKDLSII